MNTMRKIYTAIRGSARENAESVIDANAIRIFEQEILDAEQAIMQSKQKLAYIMAERVQLERASQQLSEQIKSRESQTAKALKINDEPLANELAEDILNKEHEKSAQWTAIKNLTSREQALSQKIQQSAQQVLTFRRELGIAKANAYAQSASSQVGPQTSALETNLSDLKISLQRIQQKQQHLDDTTNALNSIEKAIGESSLDQKVEQAGLGARQAEIQSVLERVRE
ncbi:PspA/IM30 family protein [Litoribacillus peritrichatus]|uniref:PspA/IM30 family protein n=1 Tax=Litoribacillus peritrichatus TaxID=718191 RepID=A0ABP7MFC3_9GAMM